MNHGFFKTLLSLVHIPNAPHLLHISTISETITSMNRFIAHFPRSRSAIPIHLTIGIGGVGKSLCLAYAGLHRLLAKEHVLSALSPYEIESQLKMNLELIEKNQPERVILCLEELPNFNLIRDSGSHIRHFAEELWIRNIDFAILATSRPRLFENEFTVPHIGPPSTIHHLKPLSEAQVGEFYRTIYEHYGYTCKFSVRDLYTMSDGVLSNIHNAGDTHHEAIPTQIRKTLSLLKNKELSPTEAMLIISDSDSSDMDSWLRASTLFQPISLDHNTGAILKLRLSPHLEGFALEQNL
jgi:hypothetical protein